MLPLVLNEQSLCLHKLVVLVVLPLTQAAGMEMLDRLVLIHVVVVDQEVLVEALVVVVLHQELVLLELLFLVVLAAPELVDVGLVMPELLAVLVRLMVELVVMQGFKVVIHNAVAEVEEQEILLEQVTPAEVVELVMTVQVEL